MKLLIIQGVAVISIFVLGSLLIGGAGVHYPSYIVGVLCSAAVGMAREVVAP